MKKAIQWEIESADLAAVVEAQETLRTQQGLLGIRTLQPTACRSHWLVLGYFDAEDLPMSSWLPDTLRMVYLLPRIEREFAA